MKKRTAIILIIILIILGVLLVITSQARNNLLVRQALHRFTTFTSMKQSGAEQSIIVPNDQVPGFME